ncbi:putative toxin-antitoxin system toxin component, PIN family [Flavobacterium sp.]|uniref:putative toxin-antitoxin system toxin component, PIN family n=1 Tax=Flavobacterium sp. TaxID=239 RepID=UPI003B99B3B8
MTRKSAKVIFDTNVWISFLIGKQLATVKHQIAKGSIIVVTTEQLLLEIKLVTSREKLQKYFPKENVAELLDLLETIAEKVAITPKYSICRDPQRQFFTRFN